MSEIFRDRTEGAMARRQDLLRKRRDELVTMPHAIRRVVVARAARTAASTAAIACGVGMIAVALSPKLAAFVASGLPGINPAVISTGVGAAWVLALVAFAISRGRSEHRFAVAMSTHVLPGQDLDQDIERLSHEHPDVVAREMAHRLEVRSAALPVAAAAFVIPATLVYLAHAISVRGWPSTAEYESNLAWAGKPLVVCALAGIIAAIVMTRPAARREGVTTFAAIASMLSGALAAGTLVQREVELTWLLTALSVITGAVAFVTWRLKVERKALEIDDPAAGSELFTLRGALDSLRGLAAGIRRHISARMVVGVGAFALLLVCAGDRTALGPTQVAAATSLRPTSVKAAPLVIPGKTSLLLARPTSDGRIRFDVRFVDGKPITLFDLHGFSSLPKGWRARVTVSLVDSALPGMVAVSPFPGNTDVVPLSLGEGSNDHRFVFSACEQDADLGLALVPHDNWAQGTYDAGFLVEPTFELAPCAEPAAVQ